MDSRNFSHFDLFKDTFPPSARRLPYKKWQNDLFSKGQTPGNRGTQNRGSGKVPDSRVAKTGRTPHSRLLTSKASSLIVRRPSITTSTLSRPRLFGLGSLPLIGAIVFILTLVFTIDALAAQPTSRRVAGELLVQVRAGAARGALDGEFKRLGATAGQEIPGIKVKRIRINEATCDKVKAAPGSTIYTTNRGGGYGAWNGTSFSSPIVAGLAGLIWSVNPVLSNAEVVKILKQGADDLGTTASIPSSVSAASMSTIVCNWRKAALPPPT